MFPSAVFLTLQGLLVARGGVAESRRRIVAAFRTGRVLTLVTMLIIDFSAVKTIPQPSALRSIVVPELFVKSISRGRKFESRYHRWKGAPARRSGWAGG